MQTALPEKMVDFLVQELDDRIMGNGVNASRIMQSIAQSNKDLKESILQHISTSPVSTNDEVHMNYLVRNTVMNPTTYTPRRLDELQENDITLISRETGVWSHFWNGDIHKIPRSFDFPKHKTLLSLWISWHLPDVTRKICPYKMLQCRDVNHISRGRQRLHEMKTVIDVLIQCIKKKNEYFQRYIRGMKNISELTYLFNEVKDIFQKINSKRNLTRMSQLSWESYVRDSRLFKLNIPSNHPLQDVIN